MWFVYFCDMPFHLACVAKLVYCLKLGSAEVENVLTTRNDELTQLSGRASVAAPVS